MSLTLRQEHGQGLVEYAFIILFVALAVIGGLMLLGNTLPGAYNQVVGYLP